MIVKARPLTAEAFMPYGQVLMAKGDGPQRREFAAEMQNLRPDAKPNLTFMRVPVAQPPLLITVLERHRFSNQAFVPLCGTRHLVAVCPSASDGEPELADLRVFVADGSQAVNYNADVWHAPRAASQVRIFPSFPAVAIRAPSSRKRVVQIAPCPVSTRRSSSRVATS